MDQEIKEMVKSYESTIEKSLKIPRLTTDGYVFKTAEGKEVSPRPIPGGLKGIIFSPAAKPHDLGMFDLEYESSGLQDVLDTMRKKDAKAYEMKLSEGYHRSYTFIIQLHWL